MSGLSDADIDALYADDLVLSNLHAGWARETFEATVAAIAARHVREALAKAADDPRLRLSGHGGISVRRLRARAG